VAANLSRFLRRLSALLALALLIPALVSQAHESAPPDDVEAVPEKRLGKRAWGQIFFIEGTLGPTVGEGRPDLFWRVGVLGGRGGLARPPLGLEFVSTEVIGPADPDGDYWGSLFPPIYAYVVPYVDWPGPRENETTPHTGMIIAGYVGGTPIAVLSKDVPDAEDDEPQTEYDWW